MTVIPAAQRVYESYAINNDNNSKNQVATGEGRDGDADNAEMILYTGYNFYQMNGELRCFSSPSSVWVYLDGSFHVDNSVYLSLSGLIVTSYLNNYIRKIIPLV